MGHRIVTLLRRPLVGAVSLATAGWLLVSPAAVVPMVGCGAGTESVDGCDRVDVDFYSPTSVGVHIVGCDNSGGTMSNHRYQNGAL